MAGVLRRGRRRLTQALRAVLQVIPARIATYHRRTGYGARSIDDSKPQAPRALQECPALRARSPPCVRSAISQSGHFMMSTPARTGGESHLIERVWEG